MRCVINEIERAFALFKCRYDILLGQGISEKRSLRTNSMNFMTDIMNINKHDMRFAQYKKHFSFQNGALYRLIFSRHADKIKLSKEKFATKNLQKIFTATFQLVPKIGFQTMSLRDLSAETGLSMGGLYSTISYKENIAIIVKDIVGLVCQQLIEKANAEKDPKLALEIMIRGYLYASALLQPWFYFLYFETRSLPLKDQNESKNIELTTVAEVAHFIDEIRAKNSGAGNNKDKQTETASTLIATMVLAMIQERYLKPWKYKKSASTIDEYADQCLSLVYKAIDT